jgi:hypothetical protein
MDTRIEDFLAQVESNAAPTYENLLKGQIPPVGQARIDFAQFLALMHVRTTAMRRMAAEISGRGAQIHNYAHASNPEAFEDLTRKVEAEKGEPMDPVLKEKVRQAMLNPAGYAMEVSKEATFMALGASDKLTPILDKMKWSLVAARSGYFITSDNPLVREVDPKTVHPIYGDHGFMNKTAEITFPLSPEILLLMTWQQEAPDHLDFEEEHVDFVNVVRAGHSDRFLFGPKKDDNIAALAEKYKNSRPAMTTQGYGPKNFAPITVGRRTKPKKPEKAD